MEEEEDEKEERRRASRADFTSCTLGSSLSRCSSFLLSCSFLQRGASAGVAARTTLLEGLVTAAPLPGRGESSLSWVCCHLYTFALWRSLHITASARCRAAEELLRVGELAVKSAGSSAVAIQRLRSLVVLESSRPDSTLYPDQIL